MSNEKNLKDIEIISEALSILKIKHAFVGGVTVAIYLSSTGVSDSRPTDDIDCVVDPTSLAEYYKLENELREAGFKNEIEGPRCRWNFRSIFVDIMPANSKISGLPSRWFKEGLNNSKIQTLPSGKAIQIFSFPYLIATKLEAYKDRGASDLRMSTDIEDILSLLDAYPNVFTEMRAVDSDLKKYLVTSFNSLLSENDFEEVVYGQMRGASREQKSVRILEGIKSLVADYLG